MGKETMPRRALRDLECPGCKAVLEAEAGEAAAATEFAKCLRRCDKCGIGSSNSANRPVEILADALENVPGEVRPLLSQVLDSGLNATNHKNRRSTIGFRTSEDAVTWTVFRYWHQSRRLQWFGERVGLSAAGPCEPTLLLWGGEVAEGIVLAEGSARRRSLVGSEPDGGARGIDPAPPPLAAQEGASR